MRFYDELTPTQRQKLGIEKAVVVDVNDVRGLFLDRMQDDNKSLEEVALSPFPPLPPFPLMVLDENQTLYGYGSTVSLRILAAYRTKSTKEGFEVEVWGCYLDDGVLKTWGRDSIFAPKSHDVSRFKLFYDLQGIYTHYSGTHYVHRSFTDDLEPVCVLKPMDYDSAFNHLAVDTLAINLMHCKNVIMRDAYPKRAERRLRERQNQPALITYKVLEIDPTRTPRGNQGTGTGGKMPLHITRGHFAKYTEDKPLFGRYVGTFWKPSHARGDAKYGKVEKDYTIKSVEPTAPLNLVVPR